jgi:hypothetical protein
MRPTATATRAPPPRQHPTPPSRQLCMPQPRMPKPCTPKAPPEAATTARHYTYRLAANMMSRRMASAADLILAHSSMSPTYQSKGVLKQA